MGDAFGEVAHNPDQAAVMVAQQNENVGATRFAQVVERVFFDGVVFDFVNVELRFSSLSPAVRDEFHGCMFSSCLCAAFNRWRKPLMYSASGS